MLPKKDLLFDDQRYPLIFETVHCYFGEEPCSTNENFDTGLWHPWKLSFVYRSNVLEYKILRNFVYLKKIFINQVQSDD